MKKFKELKCVDIKDCMDCPLWDYECRLDIDNTLAEHLEDLRKLITKRTYEQLKDELEEYYYERNIEDEPEEDED